MVKHAVALVPGFLGFDHRGSVTYFADRFVAALSASLGARVGGFFPVVPVTTLPMSSLAERQALLLQELHQLGAALGFPSWHLVGHSAGGVDAALLARTQQLRDVGGRSVFSADALPALAIGSVTTLAAPHHGTSLTLSPFGLLAQGHFSWRGITDGLQLGVAFLDRDQLPTRLRFLAPTFVPGRPSDLRFYAHVFSEKLAKDLQPDVVGKLTQTEGNRRKDIPIFSLATVTPEPQPDQKDALFRYLWSWTHDAASTHLLPPPLPPPPWPGVAAQQWLGTPPEPPPIDAGSNDGIVNTTRQIDGEFVALIEGDHGDVLGRYYRRDLLDTGVLEPGLLNSGAQFGDQRFFQVIEIISRLIFERISGRGC